MKDDDYDIKECDIKKCINNKEEVQLLKESKTSKKQLGHTVAFKPNERWNVEVFYLLAYHKQNHGYKYILCCVDVFTRYVYCEPIKTKDISEVIKAFEMIIRREKPCIITCTSFIIFLQLINFKNT